MGEFASIPLGDWAEFDTVLHSGHWDVLYHHPTHRGKFSINACERVSMSDGFSPSYTLEQWVNDILTPTPIRQGAGHIRRCKVSKLCNFVVLEGSIIANINHLIYTFIDSFDNYDKCQLICL